jgi:tetratricopeptide (TPR) repeat protein
MRLLALLLAGLSSAPAAETASAKEREYWSVVAQYVKGDRNDALARIGAWTAGDLNTVVKSVEDLANAASKCRDCEAGQRFASLPLKAAILLHAQRDRADRVSRAREREGPPDCSATTLGRASERLINLEASQPGGPTFVARISVAMSVDFRSLLCFLAAVRWAEFGLRTAPGDASLFMAQGIAKETMATTGYTEPNPTGTFEGRGRVDVNMKWNEVDRTRTMNGARESFEKALAIDPDQEEANLRRGRVLWRLGRTLEAEEPLRRARHGQETAIVYLAHLFLGQCLEDREDRGGAQAEYEAALRLRPDSQAGAIALAHILVLRGDADGARNALQPVLRLAGARKTLDPFWIYLLGAPDLPEALFEGIRVSTLQ